MMVSLVLPHVHKTESLSGRHAALHSQTLASALGFALLAACTFLSPSKAVFASASLVAASILISVGEGINFTNSFMVLIVDARWSGSAAGGVGAFVFALGGVFASLAFAAVLHGPVSGLAAARVISLCVSGLFLLSGGLMDVFHFRLARADVVPHTSLNSTATTNSSLNGDETMLLLGSTKGSVDEHEQPSVRQAARVMFADVAGGLASALAIASMCLLVAIGSTAMANTGTLATALAADSYEVSRFVTVVLIAQTLGRLTLALLSSHGLLGPGLNVFLPSVLLIAAGFAALFCYAAARDGIDHGSLLGYGAALGLFYGAMWTTASGWLQYLALPTRPAALWFPCINVMLSPPAGVAGLALNTLVGFLYDAHANAKSQCVGTVCYRSTFRLLAVLSLALLACVMCLVPLHALRMRRHHGEASTPWRRAWLL